MLLKSKKLYARPGDRPVYETLMSAQVLQPHNAGKVSGQQICIRCADGFRPHYRKWTRDTCEDQGGEEVFFHPPTGNGDPMRFAYYSPLSTDPFSHMRSDVWGYMKSLEIMESLEIAADVGVNVMYLRIVHHWPCKAAIKRRISFLESIDLVVRGKTRLKHQFPGIQVAMELFVDWGEDDITKNLIKKEQYMNFLRSETEFTKMHDDMLVHEDEVFALPVLRPVRRACERPAA